MPSVKQPIMKRSEPMIRSFRACPVCDNGDGQSLLIEILDVPVFCNVLLPDRESARSAPRGDIDLVICGNCGHVYNRAFDPSKTQYSRHYENSLHYSPRFNAYAESLAARLVDRYELRNRTIVEIGCGKGDFLNLLCKLGENRGIGFDPSYEDDRLTEVDRGRFEVIRDYYSDKYSDIGADIVVCRQVLEHIENPRMFLTSIRKAVENQGRVPFVFEVPDAMYTLRDLGIWDLIYEHCSYFTVLSLVRLFALSGFNPVSVSTEFGGQYILMDASPLGGPHGEPVSRNEEDMTAVKVLANAFAREYRRKVENWRRVLHDANRDHEKIVVWGAGSKGITFLNIMGPESRIEHIVDVNPHKKGLFVPGTGQEVVDPPALRAIRPDRIIIMNAVYKEEIEEIMKMYNRPCQMILA